MHNHIKTDLYENLDTGYSLKPFQVDINFLKLLNLVVLVCSGMFR